MRPGLGEKLRQGALGTDHVTVLFHTSEHDDGAPQRSVSMVVALPEAKSDTMVLIKAATWGMRRVWRDGYRYSKAGIVTVDLVPLATLQRALIGALDREKGGAFMHALDACNRRWGRDDVGLAATCSEPRRSGPTMFDMRSPSIRSGWPS